MTASTPQIARTPSFVALSEPSYGPVAPPRVASLPCSTWRQALSAVIPCVSQDDTRPHLASVLIEVPHRGCIRLVATDGHRLIKVDLASDASPVGFAGLCLSIESAEKLLAALPKGKKNVPPHSMRLVCGNDGKWTAEIVTQAGDVACSIALIVRDEQFPPYAKVIPESPGALKSSRIGFTAEYVADAAKACKAFGSEGMRFSFANGELDPAVITASTPEGELTIVLMPRRL